MRSSFAVLALAALASCGLDWDRIDPTLGEETGLTGGGGLAAGGGGAGATGGAGGASGGIDDPGGMGGMGGSGGIAPFCGDNNVDPGEECDDGNDQTGDLCDACVVECEGIKHVTTLHCYALFDTALTWDGARSACLAWGGDLVSITDSDEHDFVNTLYGNTPGPYWIGGNDIAEHLTWVWSNGDPWGYVAWDDVDMEPNGGSPTSTQNCIDVYDNPTAGPLFGDNACDELKRYVCERPPPP